MFVSGILPKNQNFEKFFQILRKFFTFLALAPLFLAANENDTHF